MRKQIEMGTIVCAIVLFLGNCAEKDHTCKNNDLCIPEASCVSNATTGKNWCTRWESPLSATLIGDWKDAVIGNPYEVDYEASGGFPPYTWVLNDGKDLSQNLGWLQVVLGGANNETAKLQNKSGLAPGTGDFGTSGNPIKITVFDSSIRGTADRSDNNGVIFNENLIIKGCPSNSCGVCYSQNKCNTGMNPKDTTCDPNSHTINKCWYDNIYGCLVLEDQNIACSGHETCTVAGDGAVACTCNTKWTGTGCSTCTIGYDENNDCNQCLAKVTGDNCDKCLEQYTGYPDCNQCATRYTSHPNCDQCAAEYTGYPNCDQCAVGYIKYPDCHLPTTGEPLSHSLGGVSFNMNYVPGGLTFPTDIDDKGTPATVNTGFWMGETEVTYELWKKVYDWATDSARGANKYTFANIGIIGKDGSGSQQQPVTTISWRDAMVWCNALTEYYNAENQTTYTCSYYQADHSTPIRACDGSGTITSTTDGSEDDPFVKSDATGFRLPCIHEWELAARYIGTTNPGWGILDSGIYWTPGAYASGATADNTNKSADDQVAVYGYYWDSVSPTPWWKRTGINSTKVVKSKGDNGKNALGIYDMSGNVWEWCFNWNTDINTISTFIVSGGSWRSVAEQLQIGSMDNTDWANYYEPYTTNDDIGFRIVRTE